MLVKLKLKAHHTDTFIMTGGTKGYYFNSDELHVRTFRQEKF